MTSKPAAGPIQLHSCGILDESHLRFFTLQTGKKLASDSGLDVVGINTTPIPLPVLLPATQKGRLLSFLHLLNWGLTKVRKTLFGYKFILVCKVKDGPVTFQ